MDIDLSPLLCYKEQPSDKQVPINQKQTKGEGAHGANYLGKTN